MSHAFYKMSLAQLAEKARELCLPAENERRRLTMALLAKAEAQEAYLEQIYEQVRVIDVSSPHYQKLRLIQTMAYEGARIWEKSSIASEATSPES